MTKKFMQEKIFIDTGAFIALNDKSDQYHSDAISLAKFIVKNNTIKLFTSNLVVAETYTRILYVSKPEIAIKFLDIVMQTGIVLLYSDAKTEIKSKEYLVKFKNEKISYTDAVSFQLMKENVINKAFAYDHHFSLAGFTLLADNNFERR